METSGGEEARLRNAVEITRNIVPDAVEEANGARVRQNVPRGLRWWPQSS